jgi:hypothetical protein
MRFELVNIVLGVLIGSMVGLGLYTFVYAKGYSYLSNDSKGCANCRVKRFDLADRCVAGFCPEGTTGLSLGF